MDDFLVRVCQNLAGRVHGPLKFRLILQPTMAAILAFRDGIEDCRRGEPPFFWALVLQTQTRWARIRAGLKSLSRVLVVGVSADVCFQLVVFRRIYPGEALIVVAALVLAPYMAVRGPVNRVLRNRRP